MKRRMVIDMNDEQFLRRIAKIVTKVDLLCPGCDWNRWVSSLASAASCNRAGAIVAGKRFTGRPTPSGLSGFPDITQRKLEKWSQAAIAETLETGMTADGDRVGGPMTEIVHNTSQLSAEDRAAMAAYIKSLPPV